MYIYIYIYIYIYQWRAESGSELRGVHQRELLAGLGRERRRQHAQASRGGVERAVGGVARPVEVLSRGGQDKRLGGGRLQRRRPGGGKGVES